MMKVLNIPSDFLHDLLVIASRPSTQLDGVVQLILERALVATSSDAGGAILVFEVTPQGYELIASALMGELADTPTNLIRRWKEKPDGPAFSVSKSNQPHTIYDYAQESCHIQLLASSRSSLWVPLDYGSEIVGILNVESSEPGHYTEKHLRQLQDLIAETSLVLYRLLFRRRTARAGAHLDLVGASPAFLELERQTRMAASYSKGPVLITGERGTGKELVAWAIHCWSNRCKGPFVPLVATALAEGLVADELFGHEKHAFTGAMRQRSGKFQVAEGGTISLDEIADMPPAIQSALLRAIERGEIPRIGRDLPIHTDVRVIAATNRNISELIAQGHFRSDLYDRLSVFHIKAPPLRERREDIPCWQVIFSESIASTCHTTGLSSPQELA